MLSKQLSYRKLLGERYRFFSRFRPLHYITCVFRPHNTYFVEGKSINKAPLFRSLQSSPFPNVCPVQLIRSLYLSNILSQKDRPASA